MNKVIVTITGPSASGKSVLEALLCKEGSVFYKVVSHTTRRPRAGEREGVDYYFRTAREFEEMNANGKFAETVKFGSNSYGAHENQFRVAFDQNKIAVVVCEPIGKDAIEAFAFAKGYVHFSVFISNPPSVRYERLVKRFIQDIEHLELGSDAVQDQIARFAERLAMTAGIESFWVDDSWQYNLVVDSFSQSNTQAVLDLVSSEALNALAVDPNLSVKTAPVPRYGQGLN